MSREGDDMTDATRADGEELDSLLDGETGALLGASLRPVDPPAPMRANARPQAADVGAPARSRVATSATRRESSRA